MRTFVVLSASLLIAGCGALRERTYGSWLDNVGKPQPAALRLSEAEALALKKEVADLNGQAELLRTKLAAEPSRVRRVEYRRELGAISERLQPLERALRDGGFEAPAPAAPQPSSAA